MAGHLSKHMLPSFLCRVTGSSPPLLRHVLLQTHNHAQVEQDKEGAIEAWVDALHAANAAEAATTSHSELCRPLAQGRESCAGVLGVKEGKGRWEGSLFRFYVTSAASCAMAKVQEITDVNRIDGVNAGWPCGWVRTEKVSAKATRRTLAKNLCFSQATH